MDTVTIAGKEYSVGVITFEQFEDVSSDTTNPRTFNKKLVTESLRSGGHEEPDKTLAGVPMFVDGGFGKLLSAVLEVNGMKTEGEAKATGKAAESAPDSSSLA